MNNISVFLFLFMCCPNGGVESVKSVAEALTYLVKYGYLEANSMTESSQMDVFTVEKSLRDFQLMAGIPVTGNLDENTQEAMKMPRCGVKDKMVSHGRFRRFSEEGSIWIIKHFTFKICEYPTGLPKYSVDRTIQKAFDLWSKYTDLTFKSTTLNPDITIEFLRCDDKYNCPFDGPGGNLALAFPPRYGGTIHFDDSESWIIDGRNGTNLLQIATHEIGHSLGLLHSNTCNSLMTPIYNSNLFDIDLYPDDIEGIQTLYGTKTTSNENPEGTTEVPTSTHESPKNPKKSKQNPSFPEFPDETPIFSNNPPKYPSIPKEYPSFPEFPDESPLITGIDIEPPINYLQT